ncbi:MAG: thioredoxin domain-containing protein [Spirochaetes bacterium]|nr:thioredoxin domain-containing protein [Spirochaetota bacterium]
MNRREFAANIVFTVSALFGLAMALLLVSEFFGISSNAVRAICTSTKSGINSCRTVAESPYAIIGTFPLIGQIPTAAAGVMFYAFASLLGIYNFFKRENAHVRLFFGLLLSIIGSIADAFLFFISIFIIKAVCTLCFLSYCATIGMLASSISAQKGFIRKSILRTVKNYFLSRHRGEVFALIFIAVVSFATGIFCTLLTRHLFVVHARSYANRGEILKTYRDAKLYSIDTAHAPFRGNPQAPIRIVLFIDFTCDHCMRAGKILSTLLTEFPNKIIIYYKLYPLCGECPPRMGNIIEPCCLAALVAACAHREGKFHALYDLLYEDLEAGIEISVSSIYGIQQKIGLTAPLSECITSLQTASALTRDVDDGLRLHLTGTPALFVNGRKIPNELIHHNLLRELIVHIAQ